MDTHPEDHVATIIHRPVVTAESRATLREVAEMLRDADVGAVVVMDDSRQAFGIISERDIVRALADGADTDRVGAAVVMSQEPRYATPGQSVRSVAHEMLAAGCRHLPVMDEGEMVGMVSARDVFRVLADAVPVPRDSVTDGGQAVESELVPPGG